jgi:hypothetical protein
MIETEDQRRWWFATHPEFSWSRKGERRRGHKEEKKASRAFDPESVDAYVDEQLKYATGMEAEFLKLAKKYLGTGSEAQEPAEDPSTSGWDTEAGGGIQRSGPRSVRDRGRVRDRDRDRDREPEEEERDRERDRERKRIEPRDLIWPEPMLEAAWKVEAELARVTKNNRDYQLRWYNFSWSKGRWVAERDQTFDPLQKDRDGRTNLERTVLLKKPPLGRDGKTIVLHHYDQRNEGPLIELTWEEHMRMPIRREPSQINRPESARFRAYYWQQRGRALRERLERKNR